MLDLIFRCIFSHIPILVSCIRLMLKCDPLLELNGEN